MVDRGAALTGGPRPSVTSDRPAFEQLLRDALQQAGRDGAWQVVDGPLWCSASPLRATAAPSQGWKLHVSATPASAAAVLARALPVLVAGDSAFKFARTPQTVAELNGRHTPRGQSGKVLTVYPSSDAEAVRLAALLDAATRGLPGPRVLSDRPYAPGSLVHYRYGAFAEQRRISSDGQYSWVILDPDGNPVEDLRLGQYLPPSWARCPFPDAAPRRPAATPGDRGVLIGGRFLVREAIRHANKGGVYRAVDTRTGDEAILKEARPHVAADAAGRDVRDLLRAEARVLEVLGRRGVAPRLLATFEQGGHLFLAEEHVPGEPLRVWVLDRIREAGWRRNTPEALHLADRLIALLETSHRAGFVLRDFTPNNVMVRPDGRLQLIDLELAVRTAEAADAPGGTGTPGFAAPEQMRGAPAALEADSYSLGANLCFLLLGSTPELLDEGAEGRPLSTRLAEWLRVRRTPEALVPPILGLMDPEPARRWTPAEAARALAPALRRPPPAAGGSRDLPHPGPLDNGLWREVVDGLVSHLLGAMDPANPERLWPVSPAHGDPDPCIVQLGTAGILGVLTRCLELTGDPRLPAAVATAARWTSRHAAGDAERAPGLYFGRAGIAWALYEAGRVLGDGDLAAQGLALAAGLPVDPGSYDVTHGTAGIGMALLHLGRSAGREDLVRRAGEAAAVLVAAERDADTADGLLWPTPAAVASPTAGGLYYGFAHGTAGVAAFLLATGRPDGRRIAVRAGETLLAAATVADGVALWGAGPGDPTTAPYWCHGSAGIGSFLTRLYRVTGDDRYQEAARGAATAVLENASRGVLGQCHGLAGNGEFLLDLAETGDRAHHEEQATEVARILLASRAHRSGTVVFPDETGTVSPTWADGTSGILAFLLRLRYRSSRMWLVEPTGGGRP